MLYFFQQLCQEETISEIVRTSSPTLEGKEHQDSIVMAYMPSFSQRENQPYSQLLSAIFLALLQKSNPPPKDKDWPIIGDDNNVVVTIPILLRWK